MFVSKLTSRGTVSKGAVGRVAMVTACMSPPAKVLITHAKWLQIKRTKLDFHSLALTKDDAFLKIGTF